MKVFLSRRNALCVLSGLVHVGSCMFGGCDKKVEVKKAMVDSQ